MPASSPRTALSILYTHVCNMPQAFRTVRFRAMATLRRAGMKASEAERSSGAGAYERLLRAIEEGELAPGSRLREAELAERFQISRTPVREALGRLEAQGLVAHEPHRGASVAQLDYGQVSE